MNSIPSLQYIKKSVLYLLLFISIYHVALYCILGVYRIPYPYELWWFEGDALLQVQRILEGKQMYVAPSFEYIPMIYAPLYFYVSALFAKNFGLHLYVLRLISFAASLGTLYMIYLFIKKETKTNMFAIIGAGFFAATYSLAGGVLDTARVDSLFIFLLLVSLYLSQVGKNKKDHMLAACMFFLACMTKQATLIMLPFIGGYYLFIQRKYLLLYLMTSISLTFGAVAVLDRVHHGWYSYYVYSLAGKHHFDFRNLIVFIGFDVVKILIAVVITGIYIRSLLVEKQKNAIFNTLVIVGLITMACLARLNIGGSSNTLIPLHVAVAIGFGLGLNHLYHSKKTTLSLFLFLLLSPTQFIMLIYNPLSLIPNATAKKNTERLISYIKTQPTTVFAPSNSYLLTFTNKPRHANMHMANELLGGFGDKKPTKEGDVILSEVTQKIQSKLYDIIIIEKYEYYLYYYLLLSKHIDTYYEKNNEYFSIWKGDREIPIYIYQKK